MRFSFAQLLLMVVVLGATYASPVRAQDYLNKRVSLRVEDTEVEKVLRQLEKAVDVQFMYSSNVLRGQQRITVQASNEPLGDVLDRVLRPMNIRYELVGKKILLTPASSGLMPLEQKIKIPATTGQLDRNVSGTVTDESGSGLPGVSVVLKGTQRGTTTNAEGRFQIEVPTNNTVLVFSFVGYKTQEVTVGNQSVLNVSLKPENQSLNEVVVVGYGTQERKNLTGSISSIKSETISEVPVATIEQALQGNAAGVMVSQSGGAPGAAVSVRVRGIGSINGAVEPLYVVDGVPIENVPFGGGGDYASPDVSNSPLATINPGDIESIQILKDASATAIYGARGANGVVLITTKRGKAGRTKVTYSAYAGFQEPTKTFEVLNAREYMELQNEFATNAGTDLRYPNIDSVLNVVGNGTNWQNELYRKGIMHNHQLSLNGGSDKTKFAISGNYFRQDGIIPNNGFERVSFRANIDHIISEKFATGFSLTLSNINNNNLPGGASGQNPFRSVLSFSPLAPVTNPEGVFEDFLDGSTGVFVTNPVGLVNDVTNKTTTFRPIGNLYVDYNILSNLKFKTSFGFDYRTQRNKVYIPRTVQRGRDLGGRAINGYDDRTNLVLENTLTYNKLFGKDHRLEALVGQMTQTASRVGRTFAAQNFPNDVLGSNVLENGSVQELPSSVMVDWALISYLGRVNYGFRDKYLLTLTMRADGSSRFGVNKRFGYFPSAAVAWRLSEEGFMKEIRAISDAKLRVSYGINGNQDGIGAYDRFARLASRDYAYPIGAGNSIVQGFAPVSISNTNLGWEETEQLNVGFNFGLFSNRITLEADYFVKNTSKLLFAVPLPESAYVGSDVIRNIGQLQNKGFELLINTVNVNKGDFSWESNFNISFLDNKIVSLPRENDIPYFSLLGTSNIGLLRQGASFPSFYGWVADGIFASQEEVSNHTFTDANGAVRLIQPNAQPGDVRYRDLSGPTGEPDGRITGEDRTIIGSALPDFFGGLRNQFNYKGLNLSFFLNFSYGNEIVNYNRWTMANVTPGGNQLKEVLNRWTPTNTNTTVPAARRQRSAEYPFDTRFVEDGSFIRMRDITLSYSLPKTITDKLGGSTAKVYVRANNVFTLTNYKGVDPEVNSFDPSSSNLAGIEISVYPMVKTYTAGFTIQF